MSTIFNTLRVHWWKFLLGLVLVSSLGFWFAGQDGNKNLNTTSPKRETIQQEIEVTGTVEASKTSDLSFEKAGIVSGINVVVGQRVRAGQSLAYLSGGEAYAAVQEAEGALAAQRATLAQLESGATDAERSLKQQALDNANADLRNAEDQIADTLRTTSNTFRDIFDYRLGNFFIKSNNTYRLTFTTCDQSAQFEIENLRPSFENIVVTNLDDAYTSTVSVNSFITKLNDFVSKTCAANDASLADERATVSAIKTTISATFSDIAGKKNLVQTAKNAVSRAQRDLDLTNSGTDLNRIAAQRAAVSQAEARLSSARAVAGKNVLSAPFDGVITAINIEKGEISSSAKASISMISDSAFQIKAKISEVDISSVTLGAKAVVTLDAYGSDTKFDAVISSIDPAATIESGSPRYGITLTFVTKDERVKAGMTANADIVTMTKENALTLPASFVQIKSGGGIVKLVNSTTTEDRIVKIGIRGQDGKLEITDGLTDTDVVAEISEDGTVVR